MSVHPRFFFIITTKILLGVVDGIPAARALAVVSRARVPDTFVRHDCG